MTTLRQAAQHALEALEIGHDSAQAEAAQYHAAMAGYRPERHAAMDADVEKIAAAITGLRAALAQDDEMQAMLRTLGFDGQCSESIGITLRRWRDGYAAALAQEEKNNG